MDTEDQPTPQSNAAESAQRGDLYSALAGARGEWPTIKRDRTATVQMKNGGKYSFKYADLFDVFEGIDDVLAAYGLTVMQSPAKDGSTWLVETIIGHASGQERVFYFPIKAQQGRGLDDAQSFQSAFQLAKRYALSAALGIATEESIEGDPKGHRTEPKNGQPEGTDPFREEDGLRAPRGAKISADMTPRQMAEEAARAIEAQMDDPKTPVGLNGVWNRNERFIERMQQRHDDLFQSIYDKFHSRMAAMDGNAPLDANEV